MSKYLVDNLLVHDPGSMLLRAANQRQVSKSNAEDLQRDGQVKATSSEEGKGLRLRLFLSGPTRALASALRGGLRVVGLSPHLPGVTCGAGTSPPSPQAGQEWDYVTGCVPATGRSAAAVSSVPSFLDLPHGLVNIPFELRCERGLQAPFCVYDVGAQRPCGYAALFPVFHKPRRTIWARPSFQGSGSKLPSSEIWEADGNAGAGRVWKCVKAPRKSNSAALIETAPWSDCVRFWAMFATTSVLSQGCTVWPVPPPPDCPNRVEYGMVRPGAELHYDMPHWHPTQVSPSLP
eukprot:353401-Chlamydomonas_euryale.AAC.4